MCEMRFCIEKILSLLVSQSRLDFVCMCVCVTRALNRPNDRHVYRHLTNFNMFFYLFIYLDLLLPLIPDRVYVMYLLVLAGWNSILLNWNFDVWWIEYVMRYTSAEIHFLPTKISLQFKSIRDMVHSIHKLYTYTYLENCNSLQLI